MYEAKKHSEIKSGQFMVSNLDDSDAERDEDEPEIEKHTESVEDLNKAVEFDTLPSLFKSLSLAYVGRTVTSPRWSHFMGTGFQLKQKVRLNNIIWREYHMQYVKQHSPVVVKFEVPSAEPTHIDRQCLVMNGKFWNQHSKKLTFEYKRWRTFFINHLRPKQNSKTSSRSDKRHTDSELPLDFPSKIPFVDDKEAFNDVATSSGVGSPRFLEDLMKEFDGNLDLFLDQPFPDPRDTSMLGNSDIMQPGLTQLQPNSESCRNDLITGLLQQPPMPTIMEDEYSNTCAYNRQSAGSYCTSCQVVHNHQPLASLQQARPNCPLPYAPQNTTFRSYPPPEYCYANKPFLGAGGTPQPVPFKSIRFAEPETGKPNGGNLALLNALLQKPSSTVSSARRGIRERHHSNSSSVASAPSPETASSQNGGPYKRQQSLSTGTSALIVDLSKERMNSPTSGSTGSGSGTTYVEEMSSGFVDSSTPLSEGFVLDSLQQNRLSGSSLYNYQSSGIIHNRFSSTERMPLSTVQAPVPPPPSAASGTVTAPGQQQQVLRVQNPGVGVASPYMSATTTRNDQQQQQKLISPYRRSRSQYHPNPPPYRRPQPGCVMPGGNSISSAPDLYTVCPLAPQQPQVLREPLDSGEIHHTVASDDIEESLEQDDLLLDEANETNDDTDFDGCLMTSEDGGGGPSGGLVNDEDEDEEDIKSVYLITPHPTALSINSSSTSVCGGGQRGSPTGSFQPPGSTEQRRRMSMQSSLKLLQELIQQNQERRCLGGGGRKPPIVSGSGIISQTSHGQQPPHQQKTSKAAILRDGAELIRSQRAIGDRLDAQISSLQAELDSLHESVNACCEKLPTSGAVSKQQAKSMKSAARVWYHNFVSQATEANWKFYIFSLIFTDVFETYCDKVCCSSSREVLRRSTISWLEDYCDLPQLRKLMTQAICSLSITTNALQQPSLLPQQAREAAARLAALHSMSPNTTQHVPPPYFSNSSLLSTSPYNQQHFKSITNSSPPGGSLSFGNQQQLHSLSSSSSVSINSPSTGTASTLLSSNPPPLTHVTTPSNVFIHHP